MGIHTDNMRRQAHLKAEKIARIAKSNCCFTVSLRYRDDWLRRRCNKMVLEGIFARPKRVGKYIEYRLRPASVAPATTGGAA